MRNSRNLLEPNKQQPEDQVENQAPAAQQQAAQDQAVQQQLAQKERLENIKKLRKGLVRLAKSSSFTPFLSKKHKFSSLHNLLVKLENAVRKIEQNAPNSAATLRQVVETWAKQEVAQMAQTSPGMAPPTGSAAYIALIAGLDAELNMDMPLSGQDVFVPKKDKHFIFDQVLDGMDEIKDKHKKEAMRHWKDKILSNALFNLGFGINKGSSASQFKPTNVEQSYSEGVSESLFNPAEAKAFYNELSSIVYFSEGVPLFQSQKTAAVGAPVSEEQKLQDLCTNFLKYMLTGEASANLFDKKLFDAMVVEKDEKIVAGLRKAVQDVFLSINLGKIRPEQEKQFEMQISDILAMYTFFDPYKDQGKTLTVPQKVNNQWKFVDFEILPIKLKYDESTAKLLQTGDKRDIDETYPVYSYLLKPKNEPAATSQLLFMGTPPDAAQGHFYASMTDFAPKDPKTGRHYSVGESMYKANREHIKDELEKHGIDRNNKVNVTGQSLGGALALFFALDRPKLCKRIDAFVPPGFRKGTLKHGGYEADGTWAWDTLIEDEKKDLVHIHIQKGDPVNKLGFWKDEWNLIKIYAKASNPYQALYDVAPDAKNKFYSRFKAISGVLPQAPLIARAILAALTGKKSALVSYMLPKWLGHLQTGSNMDSIAMRIDTRRENQKSYRSTFTALKRIANPIVYHNVKKKIEASKKKIAKESQSFVSDILSAQTIHDLSTILKNHNHRINWMGAIKNEVNRLNADDKLRFLTRIDIAAKYYHEYYWKLRPSSEPGAIVDANRNKAAEELKDASNSFSELQIFLSQYQDEQAQALVREEQKLVGKENFLFNQALPNYLSSKDNPIEHAENFSYDAMIRDSGSWQLSDIERKNFEPYLPDDQLLSIKNGKLNHVIEKFKPTDETRKSKKIQGHLDEMNQEIEGIMSNLDLGQEQKRIAFDQAVLTCYKKIRLEGESLLAEKLRLFAMSSYGLRFVHQYGPAAAVPYDLKDNPELFKLRSLGSLRYNQEKNFLFKVQHFFLTKKHDCKSFAEYMDKNNLFLSEDDSIKKTFSEDPDLNKIDTLEDYENYKAANEAADAAIEKNQTLPLPNEREMARILIIILELAKENKKFGRHLFPLLAPRDVENAKSQFPITCRHQRLKIMLNESHLKTSKKDAPVIKELMDKLSFIQKGIEVGEDEKAKDVIDTLKYDVARAYKKALKRPKSTLTLFNESMEGDLAKTLAKFMQDEFGLTKENLLTMKKPEGYIDLKKEEETYSLLNSQNLNPNQG